MANLGLLLSVAEPSGFWVSIIKAFEGLTNNYVLAVILLTVVIRVVWAFVETFSKFSQQKQAAVQNKLQPELEKLKVKYKNQPEALSQKQNELYRKYYGKGYYGSCIIMLVVLVLNMVIFFSLFSGLNSMASYKSNNNYDNLKYQYANCLNVADKYLDDYTDNTKLNNFADYENLEFRISEDGTKIALYQNDTILQEEDYKTDFAGGTKIVDGQEVPLTTNDNIVALINKIFPKEETDEKVINPETNLYLSTAIQKVSMKTVAAYYEANKDSFLWIENIWIADSPLVKSIPTYTTIANQIGKNNVQEGEETIYNSFMKDLQAQNGKANGYLVLPILCVLATMLSLFVTNAYNKHKNKKKGIETAKQGFKWMNVILPLILGIFALLYNSVFAIYMLTGQLVACAITPLQLMVVDHIIDKKKEKQEQENVVEYSRKF